MKFLPPVAPLNKLFDDFQVTTKKRTKNTENCFCLHDWSRQCVYRFQRTTKQKQIPKATESQRISPVSQNTFLKHSFYMLGWFLKTVWFVCLFWYSWCLFLVGPFGHLLLWDCSGAAEDHMKWQTRWWCVLCLFPLFYNCLENVCGVGAVVWKCSCDVSSLWFF